MPHDLIYRNVPRNCIYRIYVEHFCAISHNAPLAESGRLEFDEFVTLAAKFIVEEDAEALEKELREAFRLYDKEGMTKTRKQFIWRSSLVSEIHSFFNGGMANNYFNNSDYFV